jgi:hypothetical protein
LNEVFGGPPNTAGLRSPVQLNRSGLGSKTEVAAREHQERKARQMNDENEGHKNGGWGNLQIPFS